MNIIFKYIIFIILLCLAGNAAADETLIQRSSLNGPSNVAALKPSSPQKMGETEPIPARSSDTLVIALRNDIPPMSFQNVEGKPAGIFVDIWRLWAEKTGRKIEFMSATFKDSVEAFRTGRADIHMAVSISEERSKWMVFSQPVYEFNLSLFFLKKHPNFFNISELKGEKLGVIGGTHLEEQLHRQYPDIEIVPFISIEDMIHATLEEKIQAFMSTPASTSMKFAQLGLVNDFKCSDKKLFIRRVHAGVLKENKELLSLMDKGFDLISNEELAEIEKRWIEDPEKRYYRMPASSYEGEKTRPLIRFTATEEAWLKVHKTVQVFIPVAFPPLMFIDENKKIQGIVPDYLDLFYRRTGIHFEMVPSLLSNSPEAIDAQRLIDMFPAFMEGLSNRHTELTDTCFSLHWVIVNRLGDPFFRNMLDLAGMKVAIIKNTPISEQLKREYPQVEFSPADNPIDAMQSVSRGDADAFIGTLEATGYIMQKFQLANLKIAGCAGCDDFLFKFAIRNDWPELASILNKVIRSITTQEHDNIFHKWIPVRYEHTVQLQGIIKWAGGVGGVLIIISGLMFFWNRKLVQEIMQRKKVENALRESEEQFRLVFEQNQDAIFWADPETGIFIKCNAKAEELTERPREELIGMHQICLSPPEQDGAELFRRATTTLGGGIIEGIVSSRTGKRTPVRVSTTLVNLGSSQVVQGIFHDITELKKVETALRASEERNRYIIDTSLEGVWIGDSKRRTTYVNKRFAQMLGYEPEEMLGRETSDFVIPEQLSDHFEKLVVPQHQTRIYELCLQKRDGSRLWVIISARGMFDQKGQLICSFAMFTDINERKQAEDALRASVLEKEILLKEVHHRVKNNLAAIIGLVDMQGLTMDIEPARTALSELSARIKSMSLVHEQLYQSENFSRIDFQNYLEALSNGLRLSYGDNRDINISVHAQGIELGLDSAIPCGLIVTELVTNAYKYAFPGGRQRPGANRCEITVVMDRDDAAYVLTVADNGIGLSSDVDWRMTETLGMLLVRMLGEHQLQGVIELDTRKGTAFKLWFRPRDENTMKEGFIGSRS